MQSDDGVIDLGLSIPEGLGGKGGPGTNPEQLFAAGYAACFGSAIRAVAARDNVNVREATITLRGFRGWMRPVRSSRWARVSTACFAPPAGDWFSTHVWAHSKRCSTGLFREPTCTPVAPGANRRVESAE